jgi:signal transduction histidine kinase
MLRRWSIRARITAVATVAVAAVLVAASLGLLAVQRRELHASFDDNLEQRADDLAARLAAGSEPLIDPAADSDRVAQLVTPAGEVVAANDPSLAGEPIAPTPGDEDDDEVRTVAGLGDEDDAFRVLSRTVETPDGPLILHVGEETDDIDETLGSLSGSLAVAVPIVIAVLGVIVWRLVGRTLRPVEAIRSEVAAIGATELHRRVPEPSTGDEIARLAATMNAMLARLEAATLQQQRFVADASHELRSPLTRIRTEAEVALQGSERAGTNAGDGAADAAGAETGAPDAAGAEAALVSVLEDTAELQRLVDDLLHLARTDAGAAPPERRPLDLDDVVMREVDRVRTGDRRIDPSAVSGAQVMGDAAQLARAVRNLLDNAVRHARSTVGVELRERDGVAVLVVRDDGPGIPPAERERVFERFTRLDDARSRDRGGSGLGLSIAKEIVEAHGGTIRIAGDGPGTAFVVELAAAPDS